MARRKGRKKNRRLKADPPSHKASAVAGAKADETAGKDQIIETVQELPPLSEDAKNLHIAVETMERIRRA